MIKKLVLKNFKRFSNSTIEFAPKGITILAGSNNSGKSSVLHSLAIWEFCKLYIVNQKGKESLLNRGMNAGMGISIEDFSPINIPSLKYLWTNLKPGSSYNLKIRCYWDVSDDSGNSVEKYLEIALALQNERLLMKNSASNMSDVAETASIPTIAYLPPFAGISDRESWYSLADRRKLIGQGLAGAVLRNLLVDMALKSKDNRASAQGGAQRLRGEQRIQFEQNDPFSILNETLLETFQCNLIPQPFDPSFHNYVRVDVAKGAMNLGRFKKHRGYNKRDIMVEGSGFLQWLSVYTMALNESVDVILLDEPDAHLHTSLQVQLVKKLSEITKLNKQVLMASHSTDILRDISAKQIMEISGGHGKYLRESIQKVKLFAGLGADYHPMINDLQRHRRVLFVENESDANLLKIWSNTLGLPWPINLVVWPSITKHKERKHIIKELSTKINGLKGVSLQDRDDDPFDTTNLDLSDNNFAHFNDSGRVILHTLKWRRREIENYLLLPDAIARSCARAIEEIEEKLLNEFSIRVPRDEFVNSNESTRLHPLFIVDAKRAFEILDFHFGVDKFQVARSMTAPEIPEDIKTILQKIAEVCLN